MDIRVAAVVEKGKLSCCFIMPPRLISTYLARNAPISENFAEDLDSKQEGSQKLQCALDPCAVADLMVKEAK